MQAWSNLVWLLEWGIALDDGEEWLLSPRGVVGAVKPSLEIDGEGDMEWAPAIKSSTWDFPPETVSGGANGYTDGGEEQRSCPSRHSTAHTTHTSSWLSVVHVSFSGFFALKSTACSSTTITPSRFTTCTWCACDVVQV